MAEFLDKNLVVVNLGDPIDFGDDVIEKSKAYEITILLHPKGNANLHVFRTTYSGESAGMAFNKFYIKHYDECFNPDKFDVKDIHIKDVTM